MQVSRYCSHAIGNTTHVHGEFVLSDVHSGAANGSFSSSLALCLPSFLQHVCTAIVPLSESCTAHAQISVA